MSMQMVKAKLNLKETVLESQRFGTMKDLS